MLRMGRIAGAVSLWLAAFQTLSTAHATSLLAYEATGPGSNLFGVVDMNTGVFTPHGTMGATLAGLGSYGGQIYGGRYHGDTLYTVNTSGGALTAIGNGNIGGGYGVFGSTTSGLYAFSGSGFLYSIDPATGAATTIGSTGLSFGGIVMGMSSGSSTLYLTQNNSLYILSTTNGSATLIGTANTNESGIGPLVSIGGILYGGAYSASIAPNLYTLDPQNAAATFLVASPSPDISRNWYIGGSESAKVVVRATIYARLAEHPDADRV